MLIDALVIRHLSELKVKELLQEAENSRKLKAIAASDTGFADAIVAKVSGWLKPAPRYRVEPKRSTAEIPGV
jgi:hypothetical protein